MRLDSPRVIGLVGSGLVLAGWLLGSTLSPPVARTQERETGRAAARAAQLTIVPLRDDIVMPRPAAPTPLRNPFTFGRAVLATPAADPGIASTEPAAPLAADEVALAAQPEWRLVGVAVDAAGTITAIVSGAGDVHLVRSGDRLPGDVAVVDVTSDGVRLARVDGTTLDLRLP